MRSGSVLQVDTTRLQKLFFVITSLKDVVLSLNPLLQVEIVVFVTGLLQEIRLFSDTLICPCRILYIMTKSLYIDMSMQDIVYHDQVIIH